MVFPEIYGPPGEESQELRCSIPASRLKTIAEELEAVIHPRIEFKPGDELGMARRVIENNRVHAENALGVIKSILPDL